MKHFSLDNPITWRDYRNLFLISVPLALISCYVTFYSMEIAEKIQEWKENRKK